MTRLRIATRESRLALWQAQHVADRLAAAHPGLQPELVPMTTRGDRLLEVSLAEIGGKGLFLKELERAMMDGQADIAVHSMKDVPVEMPDGLHIPAVLPRADARDAFVSRRFESLDNLPAGARVGTSSLRRRCQLKAARPDLDVAMLRGNVETRLGKLDGGEYDAILLAVAGLERLGLGSRITCRLPVEVSLPAIGQGVIGIECRRDDTATGALLADIHDATTGVLLAAERSLNEALSGSCHSPLAGYALAENGNRLWLRGLVGDPEGMELLRGEYRGELAAPEEAGRKLGRDLLARGAAALLS